MSGQVHDRYIQSARQGTELVQSKCWWQCILAQPGKYDWTIRVRQRCGLMSNYFDHMLLLLLIIIIRPHCSTMYIDATCCYWPSSVVCRSVGLTQLWALLNRSRCCLSWGLRPIPAGIPAGFGGYVAIPTPMHISSGPKAACITWAADPLCDGAISRGKDMPGHAWWHSAATCAKMAELIDLPFGLWTRVGRRKHKFNEEACTKLIH